MVVWGLQKLENGCVDVGKPGSASTVMDSLTREGQEAIQSTHLYKHITLTLCSRELEVLAHCSFFQRRFHRMLLYSSGVMHQKLTTSTS